MDLEVVGGVGKKTNQRDLVAKLRIKCTDYLLVQTSLRPNVCTEGEKTTGHLGRVTLDMEENKMLCNYCCTELLGIDQMYCNFSPIE